MSIRIILADDHRVLRQGLHSLLTKQADMEVLAEAEDGRAAIEASERLRPDVVVMDIGMPGLNGLEATRQISAAGHGTQVIALSMHSDRHFVAEMFRAGARGYLLKGCSFEELTRAIRVVAAGQTYVSPGVAGLVIDGYVRRAGGHPAHHSGAEADAPTPSGAAFAQLSAREREVVQLLAEGKTTKEVAATLHLSIKTIETHRLRVMRKLGLSSIAELTKYAIREGLTSL